MSDVPERRVFEGGLLATLRSPTQPEVGLDRIGSAPPQLGERMFQSEFNDRESACDQRHSNEDSDADEVRHVEVLDAKVEDSEVNNHPYWGSLIGLVIAVLAWAPMLFALYTFLAKYQR